MKTIKETLKEALNESKRSDAQYEEIKEYVASWFRQNGSKQKETISIILNAMMDYFKSVMEYEESSPRGTQTSQYKEAVEWYNKIREVLSKI